MYREIKGYEDALYMTYDVINEMEELQEKIKYGENQTSVVGKIKEIESILAKMKSTIS